jgi:hypothetical protein
MNDQWGFAGLANEQLNLLAEAERTLGAEYLVAFEPNAMDGVNGSPQGVQLAALSDSQLDCLRGLESQLHSVVVAYQHA